jgi:murein L,D-transpeptidase YcbB/YkuD
MNSFRYTTVLSLMVLMLASFIALYWFKAQSLRPETTASAANSEGRNDRSTPPTFILPATPAVAREQELRLRERGDKRLAAVLNKCAAELVVRGYDVGDEMVSFNAKLIEALFTFQQEHGLAPTGKLDQRTMRALGC